MSYTRRKMCSSQLAKERLLSQMTKQQLWQEKIAPTFSVQLLQSLISHGHGFWMRNGRSPQHYHPQSVPEGDVEHNMHTWTAATVGPVAVEMT
jgi:hypothetical protein